MFRIALGLGSLLIEFISLCTHGAMMASMLGVSIVIGAIHFLFDSRLLDWITNKVTGFDLPETLQSDNRLAPEKERSLRDY
ncbi:hypothetical protein SH668x_002643 [Planctomicrobium sp. SH668]|uniref:hypothetical protein n=1 Tax=Planctomicrobium sp. SH668 TaxID=3448126 RepID=UPI003F5B7AF7